MRAYIISAVVWKLFWASYSYLMSRHGVGSVLFVFMVRVGGLFFDSIMRYKLGIFLLVVL